ncbi:MAG: VOC family protein [Actinomycetota bacterium]|jgi:catechol 2,3-dioxygenase-like lactoylglutathione lyase family enzyme|nr:VOC family protein [Actinomycetota bacterium]
MERVTGIGGMFFRAKDPEALARWYADCLGVDPAPEVEGVPHWWQEAGPTVFAPFPADSDEIGPPQHSWMVNFRVRDIDAMLAQLLAAGAQVDDRVEDYSYGRFATAVDPEGNRIQLWEPSAEELRVR